VEGFFSRLFLFEPPLILICEILIFRERLIENSPSDPAFTSYQTKMMAKMPRFGNATIAYISKRIENEAK
jgi:hypothetical protein